MTYANRTFFPESNLTSTMRRHKRLGKVELINKKLEAGRNFGNQRNPDLLDLETAADGAK